MERPLFWHQGLFLQPQHFQLETLYVKSLLRPLQKFLQPHLWGIGQMHIQESALGYGSFNIVDGEFMFPDMTYVSFPGNALLEPRSFQEDWVDGGKPLTVYVGIKKWNDSGENVTIYSAKDNLAELTTRFVARSESEEVPDLHQGGPPAEVKRLSYLMKIFWDTEKDQLGDYLLIPVAQLERSGEDIILSEKFIPPLLAVSASDNLMKISKEILDQISSRGRHLESLKKDRGIHAAEFGAKDMVYLLALRSLNRYVPALQHLSETPSVHPWHLYAFLRQLIGELSSFSENINVSGELSDGTALLPGYGHQNLGECFSSALSLITRLLDEITAGPEYVFQLQYDGTYYATELPPNVFEGQNRFYLVLTTEHDSKEILRSIETSAKLGSRELLPILIARALPGAALEHLQIPPQELPRKAYALYFQIDNHGDQWAAVAKNKNAALYWDAAPEDLKAEIMVVGRH